MTLRSRSHYCSFTTIMILLGYSFQATMTGVSIVISLPIIVMIMACARAGSKPCLVRNYYFSSRFLLYRPTGPRYYAKTDYFFRSYYCIVSLGFSRIGINWIHFDSWGITPLAPRPAW